MSTPAGRWAGPRYERKETPVSHSTFALRQLTLRDALIVAAVLAVLAAGWGTYELVCRRRRRAAIDERQAPPPPAGTVWSAPTGPAMERMYERRAYPGPGGV